VFHPQGKSREDFGELGMKKAVVVVLVLSLILGCVAGCGSIDRKGLIAAGYSSEYADGYVDGYSAGCSASGHPLYQFKRNLSRYEGDRQYKKGWNDGFTIARCDYAAVW
jgi:hypothetical protein